MKSLSMILIILAYLCFLNNSKSTSCISASHNTSKDLFKINTQVFLDKNSFVQSSVSSKCLSTQEQGLVSRTNVNALLSDINTKKHINRFAGYGNFNDKLMMCNANNIDHANKVFKNADAFNKKILDRKIKNVLELFFKSSVLNQEINIREVNMITVQIDIIKCADNHYPCSFVLKKVNV